MEKEQLYQTIEAYLEGQLGKEELAIFEGELKTDAELAKEVALHRRLQTQMGDSGKMNLRFTLDTIAGEFQEPDQDLDGDADPSPNDPNLSGGAATGGGIPFWGWGLGLAVIIGGALWWYLDSLGTDTISVDPITNQVEVAIEPPVVEEIANPNTEDQNSVEELSSLEEPQDKGSANQDIKPFDTNRALESLIGSESASKRYVFTDGKLDFNGTFLNFNAKLTTDRPVDEGFFLSLYNNQYPEGQILRVPLVFSEVDPDAPIAFAARKEYFAAYGGETTLKPALYYGVVTVGSSSIELWVGKVRVE